MSIVFVIDLSKTRSPVLFLRSTLSIISLMLDELNISDPRPALKYIEEGRKKYEEFKADV